MSVEFPHLRIGDLVVMLDGTSPFQDGATLFEVTGREEIPALPHQGIVLISAAATAPAGYTLDGNAQVSQTITSGNSSPRIAPKVMQTDQYQLAEWRPRFGFINLDTPPVADDLAIQAFSGTLPRWSTLNVTGEMNAQMQLPDPIDPAVLPARGSNQATPAFAPAISPYEYAPTLWSYFTRFQPGFLLKNNGSATLGANGTFAWLMRARGFVYNVTAFPLGPNPHSEILAGSPVLLPADIGRKDVRLVQMTGRAPKAAPSQS